MKQSEKKIIMNSYTKQLELYLLSGDDARLKALFPFETMLRELNIEYNKEKNNLIMQYLELPLGFVVAVESVHEMLLKYGHSFSVLETFMLDDLYYELEKYDEQDVFKMCMHEINEYEKLNGTISDMFLLLTEKNEVR